MAANGGVSWTPASLLTAGSLLAAFAVMAARPDRSGVAIAVFPPWWSNSRAFAAAAGAGPVMAFGPWRGSMVLRTAASDDAGPRLHRAGALFTLGGGFGLPCFASGAK